MMLQDLNAGYSLAQVTLQMPNKDKKCCPSENSLCLAPSKFEGGELLLGAPLLIREQAHGAIHESKPLSPASDVPYMMHMFSPRLVVVARCGRRPRCRRHAEGLQGGGGGPGLRSKSHGQVPVSCFLLKALTFRILMRRVLPAND